MHGTKINSCLYLGFISKIHFIYVQIFQNLNYEALMVPDILGNWYLTCIFYLIQNIKNNMTSIFNQYKSLKKYFAFFQS